MLLSHLSLLRCPRTGEALQLIDAVEGASGIESGTLVVRSGRSSYPILRGIPRFVPPENYAESFGLQWNRFRRTQLDSVSGVSISRDRFYRVTGWKAHELEGKRILDVGCGAGRFTEVALDAGADVIAIDFSSAADACLDNHRERAALTVLQADIYRLPFSLGSFDFVYCLGVLQHTPDVHGAFLALPPQLASGGRLAVDIYPRLALNVLWPKYWLRPITRRLPKQTLLAAVEAAVPVLLPVSRLLGRVPAVGRKLRHAMPVANYEGILPLNESQLREWAILDTFDMLAPAHDHPQSVETLRRWFQEAQLTDVHVARDGFVIGRGTRATAA